VSDHERRTIADRERDRHAAIADLERAGRDPRRSRRFRMRSLLEVKCARRHHDLAVVYATRHGPLLVQTWLRENTNPSVKRRGLQAGWEREVSELPAAEREHHLSNPPDWPQALARVASRNALPAVGVDHSQGGKATGGWLLTDDVVDELHSLAPEAGQWLKCRCGKWQRLSHRRLAEAMTGGERTLLV